MTVMIDEGTGAVDGIMISSTIGAFAGVTAWAQVRMAQRALKAGEGNPGELEAASEQLLPASD